MNTTKQQHLYQLHKDLQSGRISWLAYHIKLLNLNGSL